MKDVKEKWSAHILVTGTLYRLAISDTGEYLAYLSETFASQKILISGFLADESLISKYSNLFLIKTASDLKQHFL